MMSPWVRFHRSLRVPALIAGLSLLVSPLNSKAWGDVGFTFLMTVLAQPAAPPPAQPAVPKPVLKKWLRWIFNPNAESRLEPSEPEGPASKERDYLDARAPHDLKIEQAMRAAETAFQRQQWKTTLETLQRLLDLPEDSLHRLPDGRWQSVRRSANQMLGRAPREVLQDYQTQYAGIAQQLLKEARQSGRTADYVIVATRYLHTPAGAAAANYLGSLHLDRGEFGLAANWFADILSSSALTSPENAWRVKAALAARQAGDTESSQKILAGLNIPAGGTVRLGIRGVDPTSWVGEQQTSYPARGMIHSQWLQMYGSAARLGTSVGSDPLLAPLWTVPLTSSHTAQRRLDWILQDLQDMGRVPLLASTPLVMNGNAVYRDLRGVRSVDLKTGKTRWESVEGVSAERIIGGLGAQAEGRDAWRVRAQFQHDFNEYQGQTIEYHPLASLLFRDGIYGTLSSDGQQVFVIEDHGILSRFQPGQHWGWDGNTESQDPFGVSWKTNRLVSYDLKTGRPRWSLGGPESHEAFDLPLAGSFFYGVPAVDGNELLVVAGKGDDMRLWSLDRATGAPLWSQLIAYTDTKIEQDIGRRWFTAQVATDGGVIVCPTTVGWLVAIDRMRQSVLWAHRYLPPSDTPARESSMQFVPQRELSEQWAPSAPVIAGSVVIYTPPEEPVLVALNLLDGRRLWDKPKESWLYLAGVFDERVVLVGGSKVGAFDATTGKSLWTISLGNAHPSGRGLAIGNHYSLPLSTGELRVVDLTSGATVSQSSVPVNHRPLGNLAMHEGKLVALGPQGLVAFGQRDAVVEEIARRKRDNPLDVWALSREAEMQLLQRDFAAALKSLRLVDSSQLSADEQEHHRQNQIQSLAAVIREAPHDHFDDLAELAKLSHQPEELRLARELTADAQIASHRFRDAFDTLWSLRELPEDSGFPRPETSQVILSPRVWLSGRLAALWNSTQGMDRDQLDTRIKDELQQAARQSTPICRLTAQILSFHPAAASVQDELLNERISSGDFGHAQLELLARLEGPDRQVAGRAALQMAQLLEQFHLPADAATYYAMLEKRFADVTVGDGLTGALLVARRRDAGTLPTIPANRSITWDERPLQLVQGPVQYLPPTQEVPLTSSLPYFQDLCVEVQHQEQRAAFERLDSGQFAWLAPLRGSMRFAGEAHTSTQFLAHQLVLVNRDVLQILSPVEKRVLWSRPLDAAGEGGPFWRHPSRGTLTSMIQARRSSDQQLPLLQQAGTSGRLAVAQPHYLCVYGRRSIRVLDPHTGDWLWKKEGLPQYSLVVGNRDLIFIVPQDSSQAEAFRAADGRPVKVDQIGKLLASCLTMHDDAMLVLEQGASVPFFNLGPGRSVLRLVQPETRQERWRYEFPASSLVSLLSPEELLLVEPSGKAERILVANGTRSPLESVREADMKLRRTEPYALADADNVYLIINTPEKSGFQHYGESLPSIRVNGIVMAWRRSDGKLAWRQEIENQNLIVDRFRSVPLMLFIARSWNPRGNLNYGTLSLLTLHKRSGKTLFKSTIPSMYSGFHSLDINLAEPSLELKSYNLRMRLVHAEDPVAQAPAAEPTGEPPAPTSNNSKP